MSSFSLPPLRGGINFDVSQLSAGMAQVAGHVGAFPGQIASGIDAPLHEAESAMGHAADAMGEHAHRGGEAIHEGISHGMLGAEAAMQLFPPLVIELIENPILGAVAAAKEALSKLGEIVVETGNHFRDIGLGSLKSGLDPETFSTFGAAAKASGVQIATFANGLELLQDRMANALRGDEGARKGFEDLGIGATELARLMDDPKELLLVVADRMAAIPGQAQRVQAAMESMGRGGKEMLPFLQLGSKGILKLAQDLGDAGARVGSEEAALGATWAKMGAMFSASWEKIEDALAHPILQYFADHAEELTGIVDHLATELGEHLGEVMGTLVQSLPSVATMLGSVAEAAISLLPTVGEVLADLVEVLPSIAEGLASIGEVITSLMPVLEPFLDALKFIADTLKSISDAIAVVGSVVDMAGFTLAGDSQGAAKAKAEAHKAGRRFLNDVGVLDDPPEKPGHKPAGSGQHGSGSDATHSPQPGTDKPDRPKSDGAGDAWREATILGLQQQVGGLQARITEAQAAHADPAAVAALQALQATAKSNLAAAAATSLPPEVRPDRVDRSRQPDGAGDASRRDATILALQQQLAALQEQAAEAQAAAADPAVITALQSLQATAQAQLDEARNRPIPGAASPDPAAPAGTPQGPTINIDVKVNAHHDADDIADKVGEHVKRRIHKEWESYDKKSKTADKVGKAVRGGH